MNSTLHIYNRLSQTVAKKSQYSEYIEQCRLPLPRSSAAIYFLLVSSTALFTASLTYWVISHRVKPMPLKEEAQSSSYFIFPVETHHTYCLRETIRVVAQDNMRDSAETRPLQISPKIKEMNRIIPGTRAVSGYRS